MTAFTDASIDELDRLAHDTDDIFNMTRSGYVLATRRTEINDIHDAIQPGLDVGLFEGPAVQQAFPALADDIRNVIHIRRGGDISGQQLGMWMLEQIREQGGRLVRGSVSAISKDERFALRVDGASDVDVVAADVVVNAAGPFVHRIAAMLGEDLPVQNIFEQKIAFEDRMGAIARDMPFSIDLDPKRLGWTADETELLASDPDLAWLTQTMPGGTHCRPEGGRNSKWVKLGWAYNHTASEPQEDLANEPLADAQFPEIVMRGAAAFVPALEPYIEGPPTRYSHYGGYYTMTDENWPLIGPMKTEGAFMVAALSGFGSMSACAAGKLVAAWVCGGELPDYARPLSAHRYADDELMTELANASSKGVL